MKKLKSGTTVRSCAVRLVSVLLLAALCSLAFAASVRADTVPNEGISAVVGMNISSFSTTDIYGSAVTGGALADQGLSVIHYFATWSPDCIREAGYMQTLSESFSNRELRVFGLLYEDLTSTPAACVSFFEENGYTYTCLRADNVLQRMVNEYPLIPQTFFVDETGTVIGHFPGCFESFSQLKELAASYIGHSSTSHTVIFMDGLTGAVIQRVPVAHGGSAMPPAPPTHAGYNFSGWDGDYHNVTEDRTVTAIYVISSDYFQPGDVDMNGTVNVTDALLTLRYAIGVMISYGVETYGDIDSNGTINVTDALMIMRIAMGIY